MMSLAVEIESGAQAGWRGTFATGEVTIGRCRDADVRLGPLETTCARDVHARLRHDATGWTLVVVHDNGVDLTDSDRSPQRLGRGACRALRHETVLTIGSGGPRIRVRPSAVSVAAPLEIQILTGGRAPQRFTCTEDEITLGRGPTATIRLHPRIDTVCASDIHARIKRRGGGWTVEAVHASGVEIAGPYGAARHLRPGPPIPLTADTHLTLGPGGPQLRVEFGADDQTIPHTVAGPTPHGADDARADDASPPAATLTTLADWRPFVTARRAPLGLAGVALLLIVWFGGWRADAPAQLRRHLDQARSSVYLVGHYADNGAFVSEGTAWVAAPRRLATNAHVVEGLQRAARLGHIVAARLPGTPPRDLPIQGLSIHPGYRRFAPLMNHSFAAQDGRAASMHLTFDVGILELADAAGRPLPLAGRSEVEALRGGEAVGYVGFPMENITGVHGNQPATVVTGEITAVHDALGQSAAPEHAYILQHDLEITGGSSGSPMINERGRVIGLNNAGNMIFVADASAAGATARISTGLNVAQRVDLLRELLEDRAAENLAQHEAYLVARLRSAGVKYADVVRTALVVAFRELQDRAASAAPVRERVILDRTELLHPERGTQRFTLTFEQGGRYLIAACAADLSPVMVRVLIEDRVEQESVGPAPYLGLTSSYRGPVRLEVARPPQGKSAASVKVVVLRIDG